jgi:hypothetical protein
VGEYYLFQLPTFGYDSLSFTFDSTASNTGPQNIGVEYSIDGLTFTPLGNYAQLNDAWSTSGEPKSVSTRTFILPADANDLTELSLRLVVLNSIAVNGSPVAATGTWRVDNVTVMGTPIPEPGTYAALLGALALVLVVRRKGK